MRLYLDFETKSELDLTESGLANYVAHVSTEPILLAYTFDEEPMKLLDLTLNPALPSELREALESPHYEKVAWNAASKLPSSMQSTG